MIAALPRRACGRLLVALLMLPLASCARELDVAQPGGDELRLTGPWEVTSLEPSRTGYMFSRMQVVETLMGATDSGLPAPALATAWSVSDDQRTWRFVLRPGARFHDGAPVDAAQVVTMLRRALALPGVLRFAPIAAIAADGPGAVTIQLTRPFAPLTALLAHSSTQILAASSFDAAGTVTAIVGSGPYRITSIEQPQALSVEAFDGWTGPAPEIRRARYMAIGRAEARALVADSARADIVFALDPPSLERLSTRPHLEVVAVRIPRTTLLNLNVRHPGLDAPEARQAISLALDRAGMARALLRDASLAATQLFPPTLAEWHDPALPPLTTDVPRARALLDGLGWVPGAGGIRVRDGQRFTLTLQTFPDRPELPVIAAAVQEQLRQVGIAVEVLIGNSSEVPLAHREGTLQAGLSARNFALIPDPVGTLIEDYGDAAGDWGPLHWRSEALQAALQALQADADPAARAGRRAQVAAILQAELPVIPIVWYRQAVAVNRRVSHVTLDPLEQSYRLSEMTWTR